MYRSVCKEAEYSRCVMTTDQVFRTYEFTPHRSGGPYEYMYNNGVSHHCNRWSLIISSLSSSAPETNFRFGFSLYDFSTHHVTRNNAQCRLLCLYKWTNIGYEDVLGPIGLLRPLAALKFGKNLCLLRNWRTTDVM